GVTVCQVGEGADELFWGYPLWKTKLRLQKFDALPVPRFLKRQVLVGMKACGMQQSHPYEALRRANDSQPIFWGGVDIFTHHAKEHVLSADMRERFRGETSWSAI